MSITPEKSNVSFFARRISIPCIQYGSYYARLSDWIRGDMAIRAIGVVPDTCYEAPIQPRDPQKGRPL